MIEAHGKKLVERYIGIDELNTLQAQKEITVSDRLEFDALMIGIGGFSPLEGFMSEADYTGVITDMRLACGVLFAIPIVLPLDKAEYDVVETGQTIFMKNSNGKRMGCVEVSGKFLRDLEKEAANVYGTQDKAHPGVEKIFEEGPYAVGGSIRIVKDNINIKFPENFLPPRETREFFKQKGWETIVAFQTRNPIHRAHEYLTKVALEMVDGLMIHPIVGEVKPDDIPAETRMECYRTLIERYYNRDRVLLNILPMAMRYAGPKEAIHHAIVRQNYGISHLIIGRDHAGVGNYYGSYDAQKIFDTIGEDDLQIEPLKFEHAFFCRKCGQMVTAKTCSHDKSDHIFLSGTKVREKLRNGEDLPEEFTRREISEILINWIKDKEN